MLKRRLIGQGDKKEDEIFANEEAEAEARFWKIESGNRRRDLGGLSAKSSSSLGWLILIWEEEEEEEADWKRASISWSSCSVKGRSQSEKEEIEEEEEGWIGDV